MALHGTLRQFNQNNDYNTDYVTDAGRVITNNMGAIHTGDCFSSHMSANPTPGIPWDILIYTPQNRYMHIKFIDTFINGIARAACLQIWEDIDLYTGGWAVDIHNRRRPSLISTTTTTTTKGPTTTHAPTTSTTTSTTTTTTTTTHEPRTTTTTTKGPTTTTEAPHIYSPYDLLDLRLTWSEEERYIYNTTEAQQVIRNPYHTTSTNAIIREGGVAVLGNAIEIDAYRYLGLLRITADRWMDHEWIFKKDKMYLIRIWDITGGAPTTTPTPTTTGMPV